MPLLVVKILSLGELTPTNMTLQMADKTMAQPERVLEDVLIKVGKFVFLVKFCSYGYGGRYTSFIATWKTFPGHWSCLNRCEERRTHSQGGGRSSTL